jgi:hypothetical protein
METKKQIFDNKTSEDKLYEKIGIKFHDTHMFGVSSRIKGRLVIVSILIVGYLAYKKLK